MGEDFSRRLFLIRHGQSIQNSGINDELKLPDHEVYLTEQGQMEAEGAGKFLSEYFQANQIPKSDIRVWVSPYRRTRETAEIIAHSIGVTDVREDDMLIEMNFGIFDGVNGSGVRERFRDLYEMFLKNRRFNGKFYARRFGGESPLDVEVRQRTFLDTLYRDFDKGGPSNIVIVGHGAALNVLIKTFMHYSHEWYENETNPSNCSIRLIESRHESNNQPIYIYGKALPERTK